MVKLTEEMLQIGDEEYWTEERIHEFKCWKMIDIECSGGPTVEQQAGVNEWVVDRIDKEKPFSPSNVHWVMPNKSGRDRKMRPHFCLPRWL